MGRMITVRKSNKELTVPEEQKERYLSLGFSVFDEHGKLVEAAPANDVGALQAKVVTLIAEKQDLEAALETFTSENEQLSREVEVLSAERDNLTAEVERLKAEVEKSSVKKTTKKAEPKEEKTEPTEAQEARSSPWH